MSDNTSQELPSGGVSRADPILGAIRAAWSSGDTTAFEALVSADYARVAADGSRSDLSGWRAVITSARDGFPDLVVTIEDVVHEAGPESAKLAIRWQGTGTHQGPYLGVPPTNRRVSWEGATFFDIADGLIIRERGTWVPDQLLGALGVFFLSND